MTDRLAWADRTSSLPGSALKKLRAELGSALRPVEAAPIPAPPASLLTPEALAALRGTGADVDAGDEARLAHAGGMKYLDLVRRRRGDEVPAPDAVVTPGDPDAVAAALEVCGAYDIAVVPFGGGTSVVGGVDALRGGHAAVIALDLRRLDKLVSVDRESMTAVLQAGLTGPAAERLLQAQGLTLGHYPQSFERATIGGYAATRSAGQASNGYGRFDELVTGLQVATPAGPLDLGRAPSSAAGPDLRQLVLGSEGAFGVITEVAVRVRPVPEVRRYEGWAVASFAAGAELLRRLAQDELLPDIVRLSDEPETAMGLAQGGRSSRVLASYLGARKKGCLLVVGWEGGTKSVVARRSAAVSLLRDAGATRLGKKVGSAWEHGRYAGPRQRDDLLDVGVLAETVETATSWSGLAALHSDVRAALAGALTHPIVMCHVSHAYPSGASLYFTVLAAQDAADPIGQWTRAKTAASDAMAARRATITHHHAVGADHLPWLGEEIGALGIDVLRAVKRALDPAGIMNPGVLVP